MRQSRGFTLVEIVVVLLIFGIILAMAAAITRGVVATQKRSLTTSRMAAVDAALVQFVVQQRRLPCPADGTDASSANTAGVEARNAGTGACTAMATGVVPWRSLALTETEASDGWDHRLTYRLDPALGTDAGMDMTGCDAAGSAAAVGGACATGCTGSAVAACTSPSNFLNGKGLAVRNIAGVILMDPSTAPFTGAAYVVISAGESGGGAYLSSGNLGVTASTDGLEEKKNYANLGYVAGTTYYVDNDLNDGAGATHFDDVISRPSVLAVASKAGVGPRSH